jgi:hypothetical protein
VIVRHILILLLLLAPCTAHAQQPLMPNLRAVWQTPTVARITWFGPGCLYRNNTLIACYPREASYTLELGATGSLDGAYRPAAGDVFTLARPGGEVDTAPLRSLSYLPAWRASGAAPAL